MLKNTITGSMLAKLLPGVSKFFLENASQEEVNKAEQEAAVLHQQLNALGESTTVVAGASTTPTETAGADGVPVGVGATTEPAVSAADLTAMTTRATAAEASVTDLTNKLTAAETERDQYKAWYEKQAGKGKTLPGADATTRGIDAQDGPVLSAATQAALATLKKRRQA